MNYTRHVCTVLLADAGGRGECPIHVFQTRPGAAIVFLLDEVMAVLETDRSLCGLTTEDVHYADVAGKGRSVITLDVLDRVCRTLNTDIARRLSRDAAQAVSSSDPMQWQQCGVAGGPTADNTTFILSAMSSLTDTVTVLRDIAAATQAEQSDTTRYMMAMLERIDARLGAIEAALAATQGPR